MVGVHITVQSPKLLKVGAVARGETQESAIATALLNTMAELKSKHYGPWRIVTSRVIE